MIVFLDTRKIKKLFTIASSHNILTKYMQDLYIDEIDFNFQETGSVSPSYRQWFVTTLTNRI